MDKKDTIMINEKEIWKDVPGYDGVYQVSSIGRVRSVTRVIKHGDHKRTSYGTILIQYVTVWGYMGIGFYKDRKRKCHPIHRLVAIAFIPNPENKKQVNHKNGIKTDNRIENLEWATPHENISHAFSNGLSFVKRGSGNHFAKAIVQYDLKGNFVAKYGCAMDAYRKHGYHSSNLSKACKKKIKTAYGFIWNYE